MRLAGLLCAGQTCCGAAWASFADDERSCTPAWMRRRARIVCPLHWQGLGGRCRGMIAPPGTQPRDHKDTDPETIFLVPDVWPACRTVNCSCTLPICPSKHRLAKAPDVLWPLRPLWSALALWTETSHPSLCRRSFATAAGIEDPQDRNRECQA